MSQLILRGNVYFLTKVHVFIDKGKISAVGLNFGVRAT